MKLISNGWSNKEMVKFWLFALLVGLLGYFVYNTLNIIFLIIGAYIISMIVESLILGLQKFKLNRGFAIVVSYILFVIFLLGLLIFVVPFLLTQIAELVSIGLGHIASFQDALATKGITNMIVDMRFLPGVAKDYILTYFANSDLSLQIQNILQHNLSEIMSVGKQYVQLFGSVLVGFVSGLAGMAVDFTLFMTLAILFSLEKESTMRFLSNLSGKDNYKLTHMKLEKMYVKLAIWLKARLALSLFMTLAVWLTLYIMSWFGVDIPNKLGLAVLTGLLDVIPYIGPFISGILIFVVSMIYNTVFVSIVAVGILFGINLAENNIIVPVMMNKALGVSPVLILISMVVGGAIMGFLGVLLAVPIAVIVTLLTQNKKELQTEEKNIEKKVIKKNTKTPIDRLLKKKSKNKKIKKNVKK